MRLATVMMLDLVGLGGPVNAQVRDGSHDFDFSRGRWTTDVTIINDPFNKPDSAVHKRGTKEARPLGEAKAGSRRWRRPDR